MEKMNGKFSSVRMVTRSAKMSIRRSGKNMEPKLTGATPSAEELVDESYYPTYLI